MKFLMVFFFSLVLNNAILAQQKTVFTTPFVPMLVTYNASPDPEECWEAVAYGVGIKTERGEHFFQMPRLVRDDLKTKIGDSDVEVEVQYFNEERDDSGAAGFVKKIMLKGEIIYQIDKRGY